VGGRFETCPCNAHRLVSRGGESTYARGQLLKVEQTLLQVRRSNGGEAAEATVIAEDAVAGDNQWNRIAGQGVADGSGRERAADRSGQLAVGCGSTEANLGAGFKHSPVKITQISKINRDSSTEIDGSTVKIGSYHRLDVWQKVSVMGQAVDGRLQAIQEHPTGDDGSLNGKARPADAIVRAGDAEVTPGRFDNCVSDHGMNPFICSMAQNLWGRMKFVDAMQSF
jgi:hypothetical protein